MISKELEKIIIKYFKDGSKSLTDFLTESKRELSINALMQLLDLYANDKNSSTIREYVTVKLANYEPNLKKIGFNGERGDEKCDAKPFNVDTSTNRKNNGGGNFTDFRYARLEKYSKHNLKIIVSGFVDGKLIFILEFPLNYPSFYNKLKSQLDKFYDKKKDKIGTYLRGANFTYKDYKECPDLKRHYLNKELLREYKKFFTKGFYEFFSDSLFSIKQCFKNDKTK